MPIKKTKDKKRSNSIQMPVEIPDFEIDPMMRLSKYISKYEYTGPFSKILGPRCFSALVVGKRGSGKSEITKQMIEMLESDIPMENRWLLSGTSTLDNTLGDYFPYKNTGKTLQTIYNIQEHIMRDRLDLINKAAIEFKKVYIKRYDITDIAQIDEAHFTNMFCEALKMIKSEPYLLVLDDCISVIQNDIRILNALITEHRHWNLAVIITTQHFKKIPAIVRTNSIYNFLFSAGEEEMRKMYESLSYLPFKEFEKLFNSATQGYDCLLVDTSRPKGPQWYSYVINEKDKPFDLIPYNDTI